RRGGRAAWDRLPPCRYRTRTRASSEAHSTRDDGERPARRAPADASKAELGGALPRRPRPARMSQSAPARRRNRARDRGLEPAHLALALAGEERVEHAPDARRGVRGADVEEGVELGGHGRRREEPM